MSAFLVGKAHIDALVEAALRHQRIRLSWFDRDLADAWTESGCDLARYHALLNAHRHEATFDQADRIGRMLWLENLRSVQARYPSDIDGDLPGQETRALAMAEYRYTPPQFRSRRTPPLSAVEVLKAIRCYEYQSCEHAG